MIITKNYNEIHERLFLKNQCDRGFKHIKEKKSLHVSFVQI